MCEITRENSGDFVLVYNNYFLKHERKYFCTSHFGSAVINMARWDHILRAKMCSYIFAMWGKI